MNTQTVRGRLVHLYTWANTSIARKKPDKKPENCYKIKIYKVCIQGTQFYLCIY